MNLCKINIHLFATYWRYVWEDLEVMTEFVLEIRYTH